MNELEIKRQALIGAYPYSLRWKDKVKTMSEGQVVAVYLRLKTQNKI